jgi:hypothetical protein
LGTFGVLKASKKAGGKQQHEFKAWWQEGLGFAETHENQNFHYGADAGTGQVDP